MLIKENSQDQYEISVNINTRPRTHGAKSKKSPAVLPSLLPDVLPNVLPSLKKEAELPLETDQSESFDYLKLQPFTTNPSKLIEKASQQQEQQTEQHVPIIEQQPLPKNHFSHMSESEQYEWVQDMIKRLELSESVRKTFKQKKITIDMMVFIKFKVSRFKRSFNYLNIYFLG